MNSLTRSKSKQKRKTRTHSIEAQFNQALERYQRFKNKNLKFEQDILALIKRITPQIEPHETKKYLALQGLTEKLISFFSKKTLPDYLRDELFEWICENIHDLSNNPFSHTIDLHELIDSFESQRSQLMNHKHEKQIKKMAKQGATEEEIAQFDNLNKRAQETQSPEELAELLKETLKDALADDEDLDENELDEIFSEHFEDALNDSFEDDQQWDNLDTPQKPNAIEAELDRLFQASSINKLFRRITRAIHPDLEQDESKKAARHKQMTRLIEAREQKDIAYILEAYQQTFGCLPEAFPEHDYKNLTLLIKHMTQQLEQEKLTILDRIPFGHIYYDLFYHKKSNDEAAAVRHHIKMQKSATDEYTTMKSEIKNLSQLKGLLQARQHFNLYDYEDDDDLLF